MTNPSISSLSTTLEAAIAAAKNIKHHPQANAQFEVLYTQLQPESETAALLLQQLWQEFISAQRSAAFWEEISEAEKAMSDHIAQANIQLKQNYMRLIQEQ